MEASVFETDDGKSPEWLAVTDYCQWMCKIAYVHICIFARLCVCVYAHVQVCVCIFLSVCE